MTAIKNPVDKMHIYILYTSHASPGILKSKIPVYPMAYSEDFFKFIIKMVDLFPDQFKILIAQVRLFSGY